MAAVGLAEGFAEGLVEGYFFDRKVDKLGDAVEKLMASAHERAQALMADGFSGLTLQQIDFFRHVDLSLQGIKNIYEAQMNLTVDKVDKKAQAILATVDKMVHNFTRELISPQMQQLAYEAKATFNSLPFVSDKPNLTAFFPIFVAPNHFDILIKCVGKFPPLVESKPTLRFKGKNYPSISNQPEIKFSVPLQDLFPLADHLPHGIRSASFDVQIPYADTSFWSCFYPFESSYHYQGSIYLLPEFPGKISIHYTKLRELEERETIAYEGEQNSRDKGGEGETILKRPHTLQTKAGWKIVPGTVQFNPIFNKGDKQHIDALKNKWELYQVTPEQATYHVTTHNYAPFDHCGKIKFNITATIAKTWTVMEKAKEEHFLKWGESIAIDESKGSWEIHFDSFEGIHSVVPGYGASRFFRVQSFGGKPVLVMDAPEQVTSYFLLPGA